jgi:diguanylate cyclase (GGDEF)-like protein/PAS domain S-box-containing protein
MSGRKQVKKPLQERVRLEKLLRRLLSKSITVKPTGIEREINHALKMAGKILRADRGYLFSLSGKDAKIGGCHEWSEKGITPRLKPMEGFPAGRFPWLAKELDKLNGDHAPVVEIPQEGPKIAGEELENRENGLGSLIPVFFGTSSIAFLGFDLPQAEKISSKGIISQLQMLGEILVGALERKRTEGEYRETKEKYQSLIENINDVIFSLDKNGYVTYLSSVIESLISYQVEEIMGQPLTRFVYTEEVPLFLENIKRSLAGDLDSFEFRLSDKKGKIRHMRISSRQLIQDGQCQGLIGTLSDITEQKFLEVLFTRAESKYRTIFENAVEGIFQCTSNGQFIVANPACARILGYDSPEELIRSHSSDTFFVDPTRHEEFQLILKNQGIVQGFEYEVYRKDGSKIWISENARVFSDDTGTMFFYEGIIQDITERKKSEEQIKFLSFHDKLTGLYNRAYFEEELKRLNTNRQLPISLIIGDVNGLKLVNDAFGHREGDQLLGKIAVILRECCRKEDLIARLGGDEFGIFLPNTNDRVAMEITNRINVACNNGSQGRLRLSIALGAVTKMDLSQDFRTIMKEAEDRMYRNKLLESKSVRSSIIASLRQSLFEKSHETEEHTQRLKKLATEIGRAFGLPDSVLDELTLLAALHDIGKIGIPEGIIIKQGNLTGEEWESIWKHPEIGYRIAGQFPELAPIAEAILAHHEWWNGTGYPRGLKGEDIPFISRIISIVDAYDAMTYGRPYKEAMEHQETLEEIKRFAGSQFDPQIVEMFLKIIDGKARVL